MKYNTMRCLATQRSAKHCRTIQRNTIQYNNSIRIEKCHWVTRPVDFKSQHRHQTQIQTLYHSRIFQRTTQECSFCVTHKHHRRKKRGLSSHCFLMKIPCFEISLSRQPELLAESFNTNHSRAFQWVSSVCISFENNRDRKRVLDRQRDRQTVREEEESSEGSSKH